MTGLITAIVIVAVVLGLYLAAMEADDRDEWR